MVLLIWAARGNEWKHSIWLPSFLFLSRQHFSGLVTDPSSYLHLHFKLCYSSETLLSMWPRARVPGATPLAWIDSFSSLLWAFFFSLLKYLHFQISVWFVTHKHMCSSQASFKLTFSPIISVWRGKKCMLTKTVQLRLCQSENQQCW